MEFEKSSSKHGPLPYRLEYDDTITRVLKRDNTKTMFSLNFEPQGTDVGLGNDAAIEEAFTSQVPGTQSGNHIIRRPTSHLIRRLIRRLTNQVLWIGFAITRFSRGLSKNMGMKINKYYVDLVPANGVTDVPESRLKYFKEMRGPSGAKLLVHFGPDLFKAYPNICKKCMMNSQRDCMCAKAKRDAPGSSSTTSERAHKRQRELDDIARAFGI